MHLNRFDLMNVLMNPNLYVAEEMLMTYLFCFEKFQNYLKSKQRNIRFNCEKEHNNSMPFLDTLITRTSNDFKASVYQKPTFREVYSNFNSFTSKEYKVSLILTLLFRTFSVVLDFSRFHLKVCHLKEILKKECISYQIDR